MFARAEFVIFLDADDMLLPEAAALGCGLLRRRPDAAIACGRCRLIDHDGHELTTGAPRPIGDDAYAGLLGTNFIWTPGAAVFRRSAVVEVGGFTSAYAAAADYRLYLALARTYAVIDHAGEVVRYRQHATNMSNNPVLMLRATLAVLRDERPRVPRRWRAAFRRGRRAWQDYYGDRIANEMRMSIRHSGNALRAARLAGALFWYHPRGFARHLARKLGTMLGIRPAERDLPPKSPHPPDAIQPAAGVGEHMAPTQPAQ
jgi:hypothetical protein